MQDDGGRDNHVGTIRPQMQFLNSVVERHPFEHRDDIVELLCPDLGNAVLPQQVPPELAKGFGASSCCDAKINLLIPKFSLQPALDRINVTFYKLVESFLPEMRVVQNL